MILSNHVLTMASYLQKIIRFDSRDNKTTDLMDVFFFIIFLPFHLIIFTVKFSYYFVMFVLYSFVFVFILMMFILLIS